MVNSFVYLFAGPQGTLCKEAESISAAGSVKKMESNIADEEL